MTVIDDYFKYQQDAEKKYGVQTTVFFENGSFYEIYGVDNEKEKIGRPNEVANILNIAITRKNKKIIENSRSNPLLVGVPTHAQEKHVNALLNSGFTIVFVEQVTSPPNPKRELTRILSPTTDITKVTKDTNNLMSVYLETNKVKNITYLSFGITYIDLSTGKSYYYNLVNMDSNLVMDELYRFIETNEPKELIYYIKNQSIYTEQEFIERLELNKRKIYNQSSVETVLFKITYIEELLKKVYNIESLISPVEYIGLEITHEALNSFILLLNFIEEHNFSILKNIEIPIQWEPELFLNLQNNTLYQLNIVPDETLDNPFSIRSLFDVINNTQTVAGRRLLRERLLNPIINVDDLQMRYNMIEELVEYNPIKNNKFQPLLKNLIDGERYLRKMSLGIVHPLEITALFNSIELIQNIFSICREHFTLLDCKEPVKIKEFIEHILQTFDMEELPKYFLDKITNSVFNKGVNTSIDNIQNEIKEIENYFINKAKFFSNFIEKNSDYIKLDNNDRDGYFLATTPKRGEIIKAKYKGKDFKFLKTSANVLRITSDDTVKNSDRLQELRNTLKIEMKKIFQDKCIEIYNQYNSDLKLLFEKVAKFDFYLSCAITSIKNAYTKPQIINQLTSFIDATGLRHPIIEKIQDDIEYVPNDLELKNEGIIIYGLNGGGKSSYLKSVGLNVVLAQMGMWVASTTFSYYPFTRIFTRIMGNDNIFRGQSSFMIEMTELRTILKYADERSLILGDEICRGTEITSALSIVSSTIKILSEKQTNFVFASHLHKLTELDIIKKIKIKEMHIPLTIEEDKIIFGRKLINGVGDRLYGLEVASHIINNEEFLKLAGDIRKGLLEIDKSIVSTQKSKYNTDVYMDKCFICNCTSDLDAHHIDFQCMADENGMIGNKHKNQRSNLVVLCKKHHQDVHKNKIKIEGYKKTSKGKELKIKEISTEQGVP